MLEAVVSTRDTGTDRAPFPLSDHRKAGSALNAVARVSNPTIDGLSERATYHPATAAPAGVTPRAKTDSRQIGHRAWSRRAWDKTVAA